MIGGIYYESDYHSSIPGFEQVPDQELLAAVRDAETKVTVNEDRPVFALTVELPFKCHASGTVLPPRPGKGYSAFCLDSIFVGDTRLIGSGTGTRLVRQLIDTALEISPEEQWMHTGWVRLGAINAIEKANPSKLKVKLHDHPSRHYGYGTGRTLEQMVKDNPPRSGTFFRAWCSKSKIQDT